MDLNGQGDMHDFLNMDPFDVRCLHIFRMWRDFLLMSVIN